MKTTGKILSLLSIIAAGSCLTGADSGPQQVPVAEIGAKYVLMGQFGQPIGRFMTIEGAAQREWMGTGWPVVVDTVDGQKLSKVVTLGVTPGHLVEGTRYIMRGYETVGMGGSPVDPQLHLDGSVVQQPLSFRNWFEVTAIKESATLKGTN